MEFYIKDINWLLNNAVIGKKGSYFCIRDEEKIVFEEREVETIFPSGKRKVSRPYCPVCDPKKERLEAAVVIKSGELATRPTIS